MSGTGATSADRADDPTRIAEEARIARRAAAGDGHAFATLYDRYERRLFNFCLRLTNSQDDAADVVQDAFLKVLQRLPNIAERELNFGAYLYTAARHAAYDAMNRHKRTELTDQIGEEGTMAGVGSLHADPGGDLAVDPERAVLLDAQQAEIREANARLPERQREVLAMRELEDLSYDDIAEIMGMNRNSVAQLISRARIKLRDELRGTALAAVTGRAPACERALPLIAMRQDDQLDDDGQRAWLRAHLVSCDPCRVGLEAMQEAGTSYRMWTPLVPLAWLKRETIARASELVGADWSQLTSDQAAGAGGANGAAAGQPGASPDGAGNGAVGARVAAKAAAGAAAVGASDVVFARLRRFVARTGAVAALVLLIFAALVSSDEPPVTARLSAAPTPPPAEPPGVSRGFQQPGSPAGPSGEDRSGESRRDASTAPGSVGEVAQSFLGVSPPSAGSVAFPPAVRSPSSRRRTGTTRTGATGTPGGTRPSPPPPPPPTATRPGPPPPPSASNPPSPPPPAGVEPAPPPPPPAAFEPQPPTPPPPTGTPPPPPPATRPTPPPPPPPTAPPCRTPPRC